MKTIFLFIFILASCKSHKNDKSSNISLVLSHISINNIRQSEQFLIEKTELLSHGIVIIQLNNIGAFRWNNITSKVEKDELYINLLSKFNEIKFKLANEINNTLKTKAKACGTEGNLVAGDLVFELIMEITKMPNQISSQLDVYESGCLYPLDYFKAVSAERQDIRDRVFTYLKKKKE